MTPVLRAVWEFIAGDDPIIALGVALAILLTAATAAWWVLPLAIAALLALSLRRAAR